MWLQENVFCGFYFENCLIFSVLQIAFDLRLKRKLKTIFDIQYFIKAFITHFSQTENNTSSYFSMEHFSIENYIINWFYRFRDE